jgi:hypothetical protein
MPVLGCLSAILSNLRSDLSGKTTNTFPALSHIKITGHHEESMKGKTIERFFASEQHKDLTGNTLNCAEYGSFDIDHRIFIDHAQQVNEIGRFKMDDFRTQSKNRLTYWQGESTQLHQSPSFPASFSQLLDPGAYRGQSRLVVADNGSRACGFSA